MNASDDDRVRRNRMKRAWRAANPDKVAAGSRRKNYGLGDAEYRARLIAQNGRCSICLVSEANSVDHCHASGRVRAILCRACNTGLGFFRDEPQLLRAAAAYLQKPE